MPLEEVIGIETQTPNDNGFPLSEMDFLVNDFQKNSLIDA